MSQKISPDELQKILEDKKNAICIDVRTEGEFDIEHIAGTVNIPIDHLQGRIGDLKKYDQIYIVCASGNRSQIACQDLERGGLNKVAGLEGGISSWKKEGFPVKKKDTNRLPLMRQVLVTAGSLVFGGCVMGFIVHEYFFFIPFGVGLGLIFAGLSGKCLLMNMLLRMPWNK